jgi:hypothetical protein
MDAEPVRDKRPLGRSFLLYSKSISWEPEVRKKIMELKSILMPILIVGGWLVLYGVILPALGINT